ncbi:MAG: hypothetical protein IT448_08495 [Phycisphaerales bacterium]|nr:hypothetical protein [Phycisphaerales bacterium]
MSITGCRFAAPAGRLSDIGADPMDSTAVDVKKMIPAAQKLPVGVGRRPASLLLEALAAQLLRGQDVQVCAIVWPN